MHVRIEEVTGLKSRVAFGTMAGNFLEVVVSTDSGPAEFTLYSDDKEVAQAFFLAARSLNQIFAEAAKRKEEARP